MRGAPPGDLYIFVNVKDHPLFARDGQNLYISVPVPMVIAALGGTIEVPTLAGKMARLRIEEGTQTGKRFGCAERHGDCVAIALATRLSNW